MPGSQNSLPASNLIDAAKLGQIDTVRSLLESGAPIDQRDRQDNTALIWAAKRNKADVILELLKRGADARARNWEGETALFWAASKGSNRVVEALLKRGADASAASVKGVAPLQQAAESGRCPNVLLLLAAGAAPTAPALHALANLDVTAPKVADTLQEMLDRGADINGRTGNSTRKGDGRTPLFFTRHPATARWLIEHGADVHARDNQGITPLHHHAGFNRETVEILLDAGADINEKSNSGYTPLIAVADWGDPDRIRLFLERGADVHVTTTNGFTPLMSAMRRDNRAIETGALLLDAGLDIDARDWRGRTALMHAADSYVNSNVRFLLARGAVPTLRDNEGKTALMLAEESPHAPGFEPNASPTIEEMLREAEAK